MNVKISFSFRLIQSLPDIIDPFFVVILRMTSKILITRMFLHRLHIPATVLCLLALGLSACHDDKPDVSVGKRKQTILMYAVASNNLYQNLVADKQEILQAAGASDIDSCSFLIYQTTYEEDPKTGKLKNATPVLLELRTDDGSPAFVPVKEYDRSTYSTDPQRISEVIADVRSYRPADSYGLILWSHGTGIDPAEKRRVADSADEQASATLPWLYSFGSDKDLELNPGYADQTDIHELADAIPDSMFSFIWFDACYMCGIETMYELRNKCDTFVGYPTEVFTPGMPYHLTLPFLLKPKPDLKGAAQKFFDYYATYPDMSYQVATVCVADMRKIEKVADFCKAAYAGSSYVNASRLQKYTRGRIGPFYDFGQVTRLKAAETGLGHSSFDDAMSRFIIWKDATDTDFNYRPIDSDNYSGVSCFLFDPDSNDEKNSYYRCLDWYKKIYQE